MRVWIVMGAIDYKGDDVLSVYSTSQKAKDEIQRLIKSCEEYKLAYRKASDLDEPFAWGEWEDIEEYTVYDEFFVAEMEVE